MFLYIYYIKNDLDSILLIGMLRSLMYVILFNKILPYKVLFMYSLDIDVVKVHVH